MKTRPIPFSAPMVRAVLKGSKTQTRRVVKPQPRELHNGWTDYRVRFGPHEYVYQWQGTTSPAFIHERCPYGALGERLWVREAWKANSTFNADPPRSIPNGCKVFYLADAGYSPDAARYRHARFMPRWASRLTLEVAGVRVERLQDISEADAKAEGLIRCGDGWRGTADLPWFASPVAAYRSLWESINGADSWAANPWLWVIEFKRVQP